MRQSKDNLGLVMDRNPNSALSEEIRSLRMRLELAAPGGRVGTLAVASADAQDGRTTIAANLAVAFALAGKRTLLVDADFRGPRVHELFLRFNRGGLANALMTVQKASAAEALEPFIQETHIDRLHILPAGDSSAHAEDRLGGGEMAELLREAAAQFDAVIVDTPPLLAAAEASAVSARCGGVLLVARAGRTNRRTLLKMCSALAAVRAEVRGVVMNRAGRTRRPDALRSFSGKKT